MNPVIDIFLPLVITYKYYAIFFTTFIAALIFPIPPGTLLMASAAMAGQGYFSFFGVVFVGSLGNILGDNAGYWLARKYGREALSKIGFRKILASPRYADVEARLKKRPAMFIILSRFEVFTNLAANIICGLSKLNYRTYLTYEVIGEVAQVLIYCSIGYFIGDNWEYVSGQISRILLIGLAVLTIIAVFFWRKKWWRRSLP